jgi:hypothetical protein
MGNPCVEYERLKLGLRESSLYGLRGVASTTQTLQCGESAKTIAADAVSLLSAHSRTCRVCGDSQLRFRSTGQSRIRPVMECSEFESLWTDYIEALKQWGEVSSTSAMSVYATKLRRRASTERDKARERACAHQRRCLICANSQAENKARIYELE